MTQRKIETMSADQLWNDWCEDIERIVRDSYELFAFRRQFREIAEMFEANGRLQQTGSWLWLRACYVSTVLVKFRREADGQANTVNVRTLLEEIEKRPDVVTRGRIAARYLGLDVALAESLDRRFNEWTGAVATGSPNDQIDAAKVQADRKAFEAATEELDTVATIRDLRKATLRHRPDRIIVGEVRSGEAYDLLQALNTGHAGSLSTIHANSASQALARLASCALQSGVEIPYTAIRLQIADAIRCLVHLGRRRGRRRVEEMMFIDGYDASKDVYAVRPGSTANSMLGDVL
jgi:hypothetical protein